jgi:hypothetical protein
LIKIIDNIYNKVKKLFDNFQLNNLELNKIKSIERIKLMNNRYEEIKTNSFSYKDDFFNIHGSHRNRKNIF